MGYRIASFNMKNLSLESGRDLDRIATIIKENKFDIVAMQEVLSEGRALYGSRSPNWSIRKGALEKSLLGRLGAGWEICWADPQTKSSFYPYLGEDQRGEGYAFIWNTRRIDLLDVPNNPRIFRDYKTAYRQEDGKTKKAHRLIRDPLYGRFIIKGTKVELRLITTHIIFGKPKAENMAVEFDKGAVALRKHEFDILAGSVYSRINNYAKDSKSTVPFTLILGDYNLNLRSSNINHSIMENTAFFTPDGRKTNSIEGEGYIIYTIQDEATTVGDGMYVNNYDHFSFDDRVRRAVVPLEHNYIDAVHKNVKPSDTTEEEKFSRYKKEVSDHVPIVIELSFRGNRGGV